MKIACISDTRLPTSSTFAGHGLGQIVHAVASGLAERGHEVTLFAAPGSEFKAGKLITATDERDFLRHDLTQFDAIMDNSHSHITSAIRGLPALQVSHDRELKPFENAVFPSESHRDWYGFSEQNSRIVHNGVKAPDISGFGERRGGYVAYLSTFYPQKQPIAALEAARLAGVKLHMAGTTPPAPPPGASYVGALAGEDKYQFLYHAIALLFPASTECAPVTVLEAQSVGTPVLVSSLGGSSENMVEGETGYVCSDIEEFAEALGKVDALNRSGCIEWIRANRNEATMIEEYEKLLEAVKDGERW